MIVIGTYVYVPRHRKERGKARVWDEGKVTVVSGGMLTVKIIRGDNAGRSVHVPRGLARVK
jgi:hypothetical protein